MMGMAPDDKGNAERARRAANEWQHVAEVWEARFNTAVERIQTLEQIILKLKACYNWDRDEYHSNMELVQEVEKAMMGVRKREA
jgi:hypothetical protein